MLSRTLDGYLFGEGNTNFDNFTAEHSCTGNRFCTFYQLPPPVDDSQLERATEISLEESFNIIPSRAASDDESLPQNLNPDSGFATVPMDLSQD